MTHPKIYPESRLDAKPGVVLGPRLQVEIRRRVRELSHRLPSAMTSADRSELAKLKNMVELLASAGGENENN